MATIAVIGGGAVGGTVAAWLAEQPEHEILLCLRTPIDRLVVETPGGTLQPSLRLLARPEDAPPVDWVLAATKAHDSRGIGAWLERLRTPSTPVAVLQNGIEHRVHFEGLVEPTCVLPAIVDIPAEREAPGRIRQRRTGSILVPEGSIGAEFAGLFAGLPIDVATTADFDAAAWRKLAVNCAGAVNALTGLPGWIARDEAIAGVMRGLIGECVAVARAEGVALPDGLADEVVAGYRAAPADSVNSMLADRLAGRRMEVEARNGVLVRLGRRHGIATPLNAMATALLSAVQPAKSPDAAR